MSLAPISLSLKKKGYLSPEPLKLLHVLSLSMQSGTGGVQNRVRMRFFHEDRHVRQHSRAYMSTWRLGCMSSSSVTVLLMISCIL